MSSKNLKKGDNMEKLPELKFNIEDYTDDELIIMGKRYAVIRINKYLGRKRFKENNPTYYRDYFRTHKQKGEK